jgi:hypothetical protein
MYRIGNLAALFAALHEQERREGNEAEHHFGIALVNLAREHGMTEDQIIEAISTPKK